MALYADLYLDRIDISKYFPAEICKSSCGLTSCKEWIQILKERKSRGKIDKQILVDFNDYALETVLSLDSIIPPIPITQHPISGSLGLHEINQPTPESPVLVTGNALATQEVILAILATTITPFYLLFVDCLGHTVDMAMVYKTFTAEKVLEGIEATKLASLVNHRELILPGITAPLQPEIEKKTGWKVRVGPYCAGELPLFFKKIWKRPPSA